MPASPLTASVNTAATVRVEPVDVLVIGAGVSGLTTAVRLAEAGFRVRVRAEQPPQRTTSAAAGAIWGLHLIGPDARLAGWAWRTHATLQDLAKDPDTGVRLVSGTEVSRTPVPAPDWAQALAGFRVCRPDELPDGFTSGWRFTAPVADMPAYLAYLTRRLADAGTTIEPGAVRDLPANPLVVNCTGVGARDLVPDGDVAPVRGQVVVVDNPGIDEFFAEDTREETSELTYVIPHGGHVLLGGTAEAGRYDLDPDPATAAAIVARCATLLPALADAPIREHRVGLRPGRPTVRLERDGHVVHNYGHAGAGVTLSWGCADEVLALAMAA